MQLSNCLQPEKHRCFILKQHYWLKITTEDFELEKMITRKISSIFRAWNILRTEIRAERHTNTSEPENIGQYIFIKWDSFTLL